jgi:hypothetical protein
MVRSREAETICRLSAEKDTLDVSEARGRPEAAEPYCCSRLYCRIILQQSTAATTPLRSVVLTHLRTSPVCPTNFLVVKPVFKSHNLKVLSQLDDKANCPSEEMAISETKWLCPCRIFLGNPKEDSSLVNCQTMMVLSTISQCLLHKTHPLKRSRSCLGSLKR